jgi:hypothetical protein
MRTSVQNRRLNSDGGSGSGSGGVGGGVGGEGGSVVDSRGGGGGGGVTFSGVLSSNILGVLEAQDDTNADTRKNAYSSAAAAAATTIITPVRSTASRPANSTSRPVNSTVHSFFERNLCSRCAGFTLHSCLA